MLSPSQRVVLLQHGGLDLHSGKTGMAVLRYGEQPVVAIIDEENVGGDLQALVGIECDAPIVGSMRDALPFQPEVLIIGIAPSGGQLPEAWVEDLKAALEAGVSIVNGLHSPLSSHPALAPLCQEGSWIWDVRGEPKGLIVGKGRAKALDCRRVLMVGMDMAVGKMSAGLELHKSAKQRGLRSQFLATGQTGLMLGHPGVPLDSIRLDYAAGSIEGLCLTHGPEHDVLWIEGQGSLYHPASTATLALLRGAQPTDLVLVCRPGQRHIDNLEDVLLPPVKEAVVLYEQVASAGGAFPAAKVAGIALNTAHLDASDAASAATRLEAEVGLPCVDVVRHGGDALLDTMFPNQP